MSAKCLIRPEAIRALVSNTLYVGAEDDYGNGIDGIVEFFWFESSIDRGADFYVAVIKARTTPNVTDDWYLMEDDTKPVQKVSAHI